MTGTRPASRFEWEQAVLRGRWAGIIKGNGAGTRGGVSGATIRAVAWALCSHAGPDGDDIWPGDSTVSVLSEVGLKNVRIVRATLVELGFLEKVRVGARRLHGGDGYRLTLPQGQPVTVPTLTPNQLKAEARRASDGHLGHRRASTPIATSVVVQGPPDPLEPVVVVGPPDPVESVVVGPEDPVQLGCSGSSGPTKSRCTGSSGPVVLGPPDRRTNQDHLQPTNQNAGNGRAISPTPVRPMASTQLILDTLADEGITEAEAAKVHSMFVAAKKPNGIGLFRAVAAEGGIFWRTALVTVRAAAKEAAGAEIAELRRGPRCAHGEPGGDRNHPATGQPLCPLCRAGAPATPTNLVPDPVETYRKLHRAAHGEPSLDRMAAVARQRDDLRQRGATLRQIEALAAAAACAGTDLVTHLRTESDRASA